jgi:hypothetical protein
MEHHIKMDLKLNYDERWIELRKDRAQLKPVVLVPLTLLFLLPKC